MKKISLLLIPLLLFSCIEKPDFDVLETTEIQQINVPDGFNYEVTHDYFVKWNINNLPENSALKAEIWTDDQLQVSALISDPESLVPLAIPIHKENVKMVLYVDGNKIEKTFKKTESLVLDVDYAVALQASKGDNKGNGNDGKPKDTDGDGVKDDADLEPDNPLISQAIYIPALDSYNTIGFEDTWPNNGDYDFNDLVVAFNLNKYMNKANKLRKVETHFKLQAIGAGYDNDFCYTLEVPINEVTINVSDPNLTYEVHGNGDYTEVRFPSIKSAFGASGFVNTVEGETFYDWLEFTITTEFSSESKQNGNSLPYDFFIRINGEEGREVHMAGKHPTGAVNRTFFGTGDDNSLPGNGKLYLNDRNLPWAVMVPMIWEYPAEKTPMLEAYPDFAVFAQNNGNFPWYSDFHGGRKVRSKLYKKKN